MLAILAIVVPLLIGVAYLTLMERKVRGGRQQRRGPAVVGFYGRLQPLADGLKLFVKETIFPTSANTVIFILAPIRTFTFALRSWAVVPFGEGMVLSDLNVGLLYLFARSGRGVYGILTAGWASNTKYAFLGSLRSAAQRISYEVSMGLIRIGVLLCVGSLNLTEVVLAQKDVWYIFPLYPRFILFFISCLAETNRAPFDLPEAEAELVSGYNVEYSARGFALFFLGEYGNRILRCITTVIFFLGGWLPPRDIAPLNWIPGVVWLGFKTRLCLFVFIWVRAAFPRYRYDQLRRLGWKVFLPFSFAWVVFTAGVRVAFV